MQNHGKKLCALLLALCMIVGFIPMTASAALLDGEDYITQQLYLGEDLVLHLRGNIPEEYQDGSSATVTYAGKTDSYTIDDLTPDENGLYDLPVELAVAQMTEEINLVLKAKLGLIPVEAINETYSIREYLKTLIDGNYTRETKQLSQELLNYGAWAQKYFNYKTDNLANRGYDITVSNPVPDEIPTVSVQGSVPGVQFYGTSVRFLSKTAVRFYFIADSGVSGMTFTANGKEYTPNSKDDMYYIEVGGINPQDMDTEMTVEVTNGTKTMSIAYTPTYYFIRNYHKTTDENLKGLMEAAYSYFMAAQAFDGVTDTGKLTFAYKDGTANSIQVNTNLPADIALADFKLTDNGCSVNEDANTKKASNVSMSNVDGKIVLTFNFAENFTAGETYSLPRNAFFCFTDNSQYALAQDYIFQFNGTSWTQVEVAGDFTQGVDFEEIGNTLLFTGEGPASKAATISRVAHDTEIPPLSNGGSYALKLTHASSYYPTFRVNFGKELAAGTKFSFMAFGIIFGDSQYDHSVFEFNDGGDATVQFTSGEWTQLTMTLPENADHIDLFWNFERANLTDENTTGAVYVDNFAAVEPVEPEGDFLEGVGFETAGNAALFEGQGIADRDAVIVRVPYANTEISAPANGGDYALKLSHPSNYWPTFRINFGKELKAGTEITFMAYGRIFGESSMDKSCFEYNGAATDEFPCGQWTKLKVTLSEAADHLDMFWNIDRAGITSVTASGEVYLDNFKASEPVEISGDILEGLDFETSGNELHITGIGYSQDATVERVTYSDAGVAAGENGGSYVAKLSHNSHYYPTFQMNFGQTLEAGTTITFDVYGTFDGWTSGNDMNIEFTGDSGSGQVVYMVPEAWFTATITLTEDCDHLQFFWNIERGNGISGDVASYILIDNVNAVEPDNTFYNGLSFDNSTDVNYFGAVSGQEWRSPALEIVSFDGDNALKITCAASQWPALRINFGRTLPTGTQIAFQAYTNDTTGIRNTVSIFEAMANCTETAQYYHGSWTNLVTTLTADCSYIDLCVNFDRWNDSITSSNIEVYIDNVIVQQGFTAGADFEMPYDARFFTGAADGNEWRDMSAQIVEKDGSNVLMMTGANSLWPTFKIDFGETLKAGTTITFDVMGVIDYEQEGMSITFNPLDSNVVTDEYGQAVWMLCGEWNNKTITLSADCSSISFYWDAGRNGLADGIVSYVYIDNVVVNAA